MESKTKGFDGNDLKGYEGEKAAQNLASKLEGRAFDVYMTLSPTERKDINKIKSELLKEFEKGKQKREIAIFELNIRKRKPEKSAQTFAYKVLELVKLAYPSFNDEARKCKSH